MKVMEKIFLKFSAPSFETDMILLGHPNEIYFKMESILLLYLFFGKELLTRAESTVITGINKKRPA